MTQPKGVEFHPVTIGRMIAETPELVRVTLEQVPEDSRYVVPGQYVQMRCGTGKPGFFAIASAPGSARMEFLIKRGGGVADEILACREGQRVEVSAPAGKGFPLREAEGRDLLLIGVGSGMAPLRAVVWEVLRHRDRFQAVSFLYGARGPAHIPYQDEVKAWQAGGIAFCSVCSRPEPGSWEGPRGHVQQHLAALRPRWSADTCALACGMKELIQDLRAQLPALGLPAERIYLNF